MKKISSLLVAIVVLLTMVSTVAFAADAELYLSEVTYGGSGNITVSILCNTSFDAEVAEVYGYFNYDPDLFDLVSEPDGCYDDGGCIEVWLEPVTAAVVADEAIVTLEFAPKGDVIGYEFVMEEAALMANNARLFSENISTTVKAAKKDPETVEGAKVTSEVNEVTIGDAVYTNVAIFTATLGTGEGNYSEAGFIWVKDGNKTDNKYTVDAAVISGTGTFEYTAAMFAIENGVKIEAIPYYVTAE